MHVSNAEWFQRRTDETLLQLTHLLSVVAFGSKQVKHLAPLTASIGLAKLTVGSVDMLAELIRSLHLRSMVAV